MFDQDNNFYLISLSILVTCLLDNVWILKGDVTHQSLLGVKGLRRVKKKKKKKLISSCNFPFFSSCSSKQIDLYDETFRQLVDSVLEGYNG